jgi:signal transduction histidine kinase
MLPCIVGCQLRRQANRRHIEGYREMSTTGVSGAIGSALAPPANWGELEHQAHVCQFYASDSFLLESLSRYIGTALGGGDAAIVIATPEHRKGLTSILKSRGLNTSSALKSRRYVMLDAAETLSKFLADDWPDETLFRDIVGSLLARTKSRSLSKDLRIAVFGEMVSLLWSDGKFDAALRLEQLWTDLAKTHAFSLRCGYPMQGFDRHDHGEMFLKICAEHTAVIPNESYTALEDEAQRLRNITHLQQRAQALENEILERKRAELELRIAHHDLEKRVTERTLELEQKNVQIQKQAARLEAANQGLRELSARLLRVQDEERRRIARDLHDSTGQVLALLSMNLSALQEPATAADSEIGKAICENLAIVNQVSGELRTISYLLHPPLLDEMGLLSALHWFADGFEQRSGIKVNLDLDSEFGRVSRDLETAIFRVVQESLTNIHRHAESPTAAIRLKQAGECVTLDIEDAGKGICPEKLSEISSAGLAGVGLRGMRERIENLCGTFDVTSSEKGTCIRISVPVSAFAASA